MNGDLFIYLLTIGRTRRVRIDAGRRVVRLRVREDGGVLGAEEFGNPVPGAEHGRTDGHRGPGELYGHLEHLHTGGAAKASLVFFVVGFAFTVYLSLVKLFTEKWIRNQAELRCIMGRTHIHTRLKLNPSLRKKIVFVRLKRFLVCDVTLSVVLVGKTFQYWLLCVCLFACVYVCAPHPILTFSVTSHISCENRHFFFNVLL